MVRNSLHIYDIKWRSYQNAISNPDLPRRCDVCIVSKYGGGSNQGDEHSEWKPARAYVIQIRVIMAIIYTFVA